MKRMLLVIIALLLSVAWRSALAQEMQGEFTNPNSGETFRLDRTATELRNSTARMAGT